LKRVDVDGGTPRALADVDFPRGGAWGTDGTIIYAPATFGPLYRVSARGGAVEQVTRFDEKLQESTHRWPAFLPDGQHLLVFTRGAAKNGPRADTVYVFDLRTGERKLVIPVPSMARYSNGSLFYVRDGTLFAHPFDTKTLQLHGEPVAIVNKI